MLQMVQHGTKFTLAKLLSNFSLGDQPTVGEPVKDVNRRLVIGFSITWHTAINASVACNGHIDLCKPPFSFASAVFLFNACSNHNALLRISNLLCRLSFIEIKQQ